MPILTSTACKKGTIPIDDEWVEWSRLNSMFPILAGELPAFFVYNPKAKGTEMEPPVKMKVGLNYSLEIEQIMPWMWQVKKVWEGQFTHEKTIGSVTLVKRRTGKGKKRRIKRRYCAMFFSTTKKRTVKARRGISRKPSKQGHYLGDFMSLHAAKRAFYTTNLI